MTATTKKSRQLTVEALESRDLMDAGLGSALAAPLLPAASSDALQSSQARIQVETHQTGYIGGLADLQKLIADHVKAHQNEYKDYAEEIAKIFNQKIVDGGWNRWLIGNSHLQSFDYSQGQLTVVLRVEGAVIESGTVTIRGQLRFDGIRNWYFACTDVFARTESGQQYVMFGSNLEDHVKPLLTYVIPGGPMAPANFGVKAVSNAVASDSANAPTTGCNTNQMNEAALATVAAQTSALETGARDALFAQFDHGAW